MYLRYAVRGHASAVGASPCLYGNLRPECSGGVQARCSTLEGSVAGSLMHCMDLTTQRTTQRHMMMLHVLEREKLMFLQMFWVVQQEQSLLHLLSVLKMNSSMKLGVWATVQLRIAIGRPRHAVAQLRHRWWSVVGFIRR